jgi:hypothetical protein
MWCTDLYRYVPSTYYKSRFRMSFRLPRSASDSEEVEILRRQQRLGLRTPDRDDDPLSPKSIGYQAMRGGAAINPITLYTCMQSGPKVGTCCS